MLQCLSVKSPSSSIPTSPPPDSRVNYHPPPSQGPSADGTPRSTDLRSPINLLHEYRLSLYTDSYNEVWTRIRVVGGDSPDQEVQIQHQESIEETRERILSQVLRPNKEDVQEALGRARPGKLTRLVLEYLDESQNTTALFLLLQEGVHQARAAYDPLVELLSVLPPEAGSLTASQCHRANEIFAEFDSRGDPFPCPTVDGFVQMRRRFSELKQYLDNRIKRSNSRAYVIRRASSGPALCLIGTAVVAAVAAAAITAHSLLAVVVAAPCAANYTRTPRRFARRELARAAQLSTAVKLTYAFDRHLETIDRLVEKVQTRIERDRELIRMGIVRGGEPYPVQQVVKHLRSNPSNLLDDLEHLEEDICLCFTTVNRVRGLLLEQPWRPSLFLLLEESRHSSAQHCPNMLQCLSSNSSSLSSQPASAPVGGPSPHPPPSEGPSTNGTPQSSGILSPINIHRQYDHALQSDSYREIWTLFHESCLNSHAQEVHVYCQEAWERTRDRVLTEVLRPDSKVVKEALGRVKRSELTDLASAFFDESEKATELFINLQAGVHQARAIYTPLLNLLSVLPLDTEGLSVAQCRRAEEIFIQFSRDENPLPFTGSNIFKPMRECSLKLKEHLISCVRKSRSRVRLVRRVIPCLQPGKFVERELSCASRLDGAARAVYAQYEHLETVDRLVERLQTTIEGDRWLIQIGLERSNDTASTQEVLKHLKRSPSNFLEQLDHLVVDTCLWFTNANKARELLFQEIRPRADAP